MVITQLCQLQFYLLSFFLPVFELFLYQCSFFITEIRVERLIQRER